MHLVYALVLSFICCLAAQAADVGVFVRSGTSSLSPSASKTWVFDTSDNQLKMYDGAAWQTKLLPKIVLAQSAAPGAGNDSSQGYLPGALWVDTTNKQAWLCGDATVGAAVWHQVTNRIAASDIVNKLTTSDIASDFVASGALAIVPGSGLSATTSGGVAYVSGNRVVVAGGAHTYTASKDTYEYLQSSGSINRVEVANSDPAPSGQTGLALQKIVTDGSNVTAVTQLALTAPRLRASAAQVSNEAVSLAQGDGRYAPISITQTGTAYQTYVRDGSGNAGFVSLTNSYLPVLSLAKGGTNNASLPGTNLAVIIGQGGSLGETPAPSAGLQKLRSNSGNTALEFVTDTNGTVTSVNANLTGLPWLTVGSAVTSSGNIGISPLCAKGDLIVGSGTNTTSAVSVGSDGLPLVANSAAGNGVNYAVLGLVGGGTNNGSLAGTNWTFGVFDGSKMINSPAVTALQSVRRSSDGTSWEAFTPAAGTSNVLGGDGSDGAVTKGAVSVSATQINATTFTQTASTTTTWAPGSIVNATGAATFNGTSTVTDLGNGGVIVRYVAYNNVGSNGGHSWGSTIGSTYYGGGAGGGFGGPGGSGGQDGNGSATQGIAGKAEPVNAFASGGAGGSSYDALGGSRGGNIRICAGGALSIANGGSITANGSAGANSAATGGAGGGSGGYIGLYSKTSITFNTGSSVTANGGGGGNAVNGSHGKGGGGGGGYVLYMSPSNTVTVAPTATGGALNTTGIATGASAGSAGVVTGITGTPNLPLIAHLENTPAITMLATVNRFRTGNYSGQVNLNLTHKQIADTAAALAAKPGEFYVLRTALLHGASEQEIAKLTVIDCKGFGDQVEAIQTGTVVQFVDTEKSELGNAA